MATAAYRGEFTVRDRGRDLPARISVGTSDMLSAQAWKPFLLSSDPVVLTWEECALTDVIHRSQLQLNLIAESDGDYRDLTQSAEAIYCLLEVDAGSGFSRWWAGAYADTTWLEPFSREKGYDVQMTFSDFGYLERLDYDGSNFGSTSQGAANVGSIVSWLVSLFSGNVSLPEVRWMLMPSARMNNTALSELLVQNALFTEDDGTPRNMLDILTDVLEPANVHIMQYGGKVWLFSPDCGASFDAGYAVSGTLEAAGTDAELESCSLYRRAVLEFNPAGAIVRGYTVDSNNFLYQTYADLFQYKNGVILMAMDDADSCRAMTYDNGDTYLMTLIWLSSSQSLSWAYGVPEKVTKTPQLTDTDVFQHPFVFNIFNDDYSLPIIKKRVRIKASMFAVSTRAQSLAQLFFEISFTSGQTGKKQYYRRNTDTEVGMPGYIWDDSPASSYNDNPYAEQTLTEASKVVFADAIEGYIDVPNEPGTIEVNPIFNRFNLEGTDYYLIAVGINSIDAQLEGFFDSSVLEFSQAKRIEISQSASDVFSKSFRLGTVIGMSVDMPYVFFDEEWNAKVHKGTTLLDLYADFIGRNYKVTEDTPVRRRVRGSYMYGHTEGFPLFLAESAAPLKSLKRDDRAFFLMSEQWRLRTGIAQLMLEEASLVPPTGGYIYVRPESLELASGAAGVLKVLTGYDNVQVFPSVGLTVSQLVLTGGREDITVTADDNLTGSPLSLLVLFRLSTTQILYRVPVTVSPASDEPIVISESLFFVPAYGGTFQLSLTSSTSWEVAVSDSAGLGVKVSPSEGRTGESSPEVTVSGLAARNDREAVVTFSDKWGNMVDLTLMQRAQNIADGITEDIVLDADEAEIHREVTTNAAAVRVEIPDALWARLDSAFVQVNGEDIVEMQPSVPAVVNVCGDVEGAKLFFISLYFRSGIAGVDGTITETALFGDEEVPLAEITISDKTSIMTEDGAQIVSEDGQYGILLG